MKDMINNEQKQIAEKITIKYVEKIANVITIKFVYLVLVCLGGVFMAVPLMYLVDSFYPISYYQAYGLFVLIGILKL